MEITAIKNGIVIDHIENTKTQRVFACLQINDNNEMVSMAFNLSSHEMNRKGIIKIENKELSQIELDKIALLSPGTTINYIKDGKVIKKYKCVLPEKINKIIVCKNSNCITNNERNIWSSFHLYNDNDKIKAECLFCERSYNIDDLGLKHETH